MRFIILPAKILTLERRSTVKPYANPRQGRWLDTRGDLAWPLGGGQVAQQGGSRGGQLTGATGRAGVW